MAARLFHMAHDADIFHRLGGVEAAVRIARERAGRVYDPQISACFARVGPGYLRRLQSVPAWESLLEHEPPPVRRLMSLEVEAIIETIADFIDLRSPYTLGHSRGVAELAEGGARRLGLSEEESRAVRLAGLLHDLGRVGVPATFWDRGVPPTASEWERMKTHPSLTEMLLARSTALGHLGTMAGLHHERLDGSGYRGFTGSSLPVTGRLLAAADTYHTKLEPRPHRAPLPPSEAVDAVLRLVENGQLDRDAADAILQAAGHPPSAERGPRPASLTEREVEVLRLAVRGLSNRQIAELLVVSPKTVGHHIEHIYEKAGVSTRVGATLFALQHGLLDGS